MSRLARSLVIAALITVSVTGCHIGASVHSNPGVVISHMTTTPPTRGATPSASG
ncbi:MAG: hypothetical protein M3Z75_05490 [Actinomycetota bacterium]|nr:hypothetical protein [Actinomycetota bacterium]